MDDPGQLRIEDYTYELPDDRIALHPLDQRDQSKLLIWQNNLISEDTYSHIANRIPAGSLLVFNNTRVVEARLLFQKPTGGAIEIFCLEPAEKYSNIYEAMHQTGSVLWKCLIGGASKWKTGQLLELRSAANNSAILRASMILKQNDTYLIELSWEPAELSFAEVLHEFGKIPLPPYIKRAPIQNDTERYQTIYASEEGSVAAPTAGLHFTPAVMGTLTQKSIDTAYVTLHVGAGTFKPVKAETMQDHEMHGEFFEVSASLIEQILAAKKNKIIAVGTTSLRTLESLYWLGCKLMRQQHPALEHSMLKLGQWEAYELATYNIPIQDALSALLDHIRTSENKKLYGKTQLLIAPGYTFRIINGLITNFHQPQSTLLLLVAALVGPRWREIYDYALENNFRFLSYGDGSLLIPEESEPM